MSKAKPGPWMYHSSLVTEQHPYEIAMMSVRQALLDNVNGWLPYKIRPVCTSIILSYFRFIVEQ